MIDFSALDHHAFESLVYDLLSAGGFSNIQWRGGGADGGRDIEATSIQEDASGHAATMRWFCDAKLYGRGIPFETILPTLARATATNPDYLLIVALPYLTPQCKDLLVEWQRTNSPRFQIRTWECKDIERRLLDHPNILRRHLPASWTANLSLESSLREAVTVLRHVASDVKTVWRGPDRRPFTDLLRVTPRQPEDTVFTIDKTQKLSQSEWAFVYWLLRANRQIQELLAAAFNLHGGEIALLLEWADSREDLLIVPAAREDFLPDTRKAALQHILGRLLRDEMDTLRAHGLVAMAASVPPHTEASATSFYVISATAPNREGSPDTSEAG
jgi:hypothetical protein